mmetsp:Transcript_7789/g.9439  ORF Transcript_7789/g.9439 Transcript_7789/m.9439 type:complete len:151 (+) Transcript_7789:899-1351(+)
MRPLWSLSHLPIRSRISACPWASSMVISIPDGAVGARIGVDFLMAANEGSARTNAATSAADALFNNRGRPSPLDVLRVEESTFRPGRRRHEVGTVGNSGANRDLERDAGGTLTVRVGALRDNVELCDRDTSATETVAASPQNTARPDTLV